MHKCMGRLAIQLNEHKGSECMQQAQCRYKTKLLISYGSYLIGIFTKMEIFP